MGFRDRRARWRQRARMILGCALFGFQTLGVDAETVSLDAACFGVQSPQQVGTERCQMQQRWVIEAAIIAEEKGEVTLSDIGFGVFEFDFQGQRVACLRSGAEMKCLPVAKQALSDTNS